MKKKLSNRAQIIISVVCVMTICLGVVGLAALSPNRLTTRPSDSTNPLDNTNYVTVTEKDGIKYINYTVSGTPGKPTAGMPEKGTIRLHDSDGDGVNDYMYVFGYGYNSVKQPVSNSLTNWKDTKTNSWGCVALDKNKTSYPAPAGYVDDYPVEHMTYAYANCKKLTTTIDNNGKAPFALPQIPHTALYTAHIFDGCTSLKAVSLTTGGLLGTSAFENCPNLTRIYIGKNVNGLGVAIFGSSGSATYQQQCAISIEGTRDENIDKVFVANQGCTYYYDADIMMWALGYDQ